MEGTVTISTEEYNKLKEFERAIKKRQVFTCTSGYSHTTYYAGPKHEFVAALHAEIENQKKLVCYYRGKAIQKPKKRGWFR